MGSVRLFWIQKESRCAKSSRSNLSYCTENWTGQTKKPLHWVPKHYNLFVEWQVNKYRAKDPPPKQKLAVPAVFPKYLFIVEKKSENECTKAIGKLTMIAFYYLLRLGKYTPIRGASSSQKSNKKKQSRKAPKTRTVQFWVKEIGFWRENKILLHRSKLSELLSASSVTLIISNQKKLSRWGY